MKKLTLLLFLVSFDLWSSCPVDDPSRCYSCNQRIYEYEQVCGDASTWVKTAKVSQGNHQEQEIELVFLNKSSKINIWLMEDDKCFTVTNKGREVSIPISQREDWENFRTKKPEVEIESGCSSNVPLTVCEDPLPPVSCVSEEVTNEDGEKVCEQKYEEKPYAWEKVIYEVREANGQNFCMKNDTYWIEVPPRPCLPCGFVPAGGGGTNGSPSGGDGSGEGQAKVESTNPIQNPGQNPKPTPHQTPKGDQIIGPTMRSLGISNV